MKNSCLAPIGFELVAFFSHFQFKASNRDFATKVLKDVVELLKDNDNERIKDWAKPYLEYDYQVTAGVFFIFTSRELLRTPQKYHIR